MSSANFRRWSFFVSGCDDPVPTTAEEHRREALRLLDAADGSSSAAERIAAAQVHATLACTAPERAGGEQA